MSYREKVPEWYENLKHGVKLREQKLCSLEETQVNVTTSFMSLKGCHGDKETASSVWAPRRSYSLAHLFQNRTGIV